MVTRSHPLQNAHQTAESLKLWWAHHPLPVPVYCTRAYLEAQTRTPMHALAPALELLGWRKVRRCVEGLPRTLWLPPGSSV